MTREEWADLVSVAAMLDAYRVGGNDEGDDGQGRCQWAGRVEQGCGSADEQWKGDGEWN